MAVANKSGPKGTRAELALKKVLIRKTGLNWQRTPGSGALDEKHGLKADLYIPQEKNFFSIEVKHYKDTYLNFTLLTGKSPKLIEWWNQAKRQAKQNGNNPLLAFKHDRSKWFCMGQGICVDDIYRCIYLPHEDVDIMLLDDWLSTKPIFIK